MNRQETGRLLSCISAVYPSFARDRNPEIINGIWQRIFEEVPFKEVEQAFYEFIRRDTKGFPPTPGALNAMIIRPEEEQEITEDRAWALVSKAASRGGYSSREEFDKLPPEVQEVVGSPSQIYEWSQMGSRDFHSYVASWFRRAWRDRQRRNRMYCLPAEEPEKLLPD